MQIAAWIMLVFTGSLLLMVLSGRFFHDYIVGVRVLGAIGWICLLAAIPMTVAVWGLWALLPPTIGPPGPLYLSIGVIGGVLMFGGVVAGMEVWRLIRALTVTENKTNLLVHVSNRLADVEDYLRILHDNLMSGVQPGMHHDARRRLQDHGVLPTEPEPEPQPQPEAAAPVARVATVPRTPADPPPIPQTRILRKAIGDGDDDDDDDIPDAVPPTPPSSERRPAIEGLSDLRLDDDPGSAS